MKWPHVTDGSGVVTLGPVAAFLDELTQALV
jgi:hypothetical protein